MHFEYFMALQAISIIYFRYFSYSMFLGYLSGEELEGYYWEFRKKS